MEQVFSLYDWQNHPWQDRYRYCPMCGTDLRVRKIGHQQRKYCPQCGFIHFQNPSPGVTIVVEEDGEVLLGKRTGDLQGGKWAFPSGYIEFGDDFISAAVKEMKEETNLIVEIKRIINVESAFISPQLHFFTVYLQAEITGGELQAGDDLSDASWFDIHGELPKMAFPPDVEIINALRNGAIPGIEIRR